MSENYERKAMNQVYEIITQGGGSEVSLEMKKTIIQTLIEYYDALEEYEKCGNLKISLDMLEIMNGNDSSQEIR
jgi:hypothetical protein